MATASSSKYQIYHCICNQTILASTQPLEDYRRRGGDAQDKAYILPLFQLSSSNESENNMPTPAISTAEAASATNLTDSTIKDSLSKAKVSEQFAVLHAASISLQNPKKPLIIMRSDGFEPRYQVKCGRCNLVVGYHLDKSHYSVGTQVEGQDEIQDGPREDVLYVLPDALKLLE